VAVRLKNSANPGASFFVRLASSMLMKLSAVVLVSKKFLPGWRTDLSMLTTVSLLSLFLNILLKAKAVISPLSFLSDGLL